MKPARSNPRQQSRTRRNQWPSRGLLAVSIGSLATAVTIGLLGGPSVVVAGLFTAATTAIAGIAARR